MLTEGRHGAHIIYVSLNYFCNQKCLMCGVPFKKHSKYRLLMQEYCEQLASIPFALTKNDSVVLTGGEPLLFPLVYDFINHVRNQYQCHIGMFTNGQMLSHDGVVERLEASGLNSLTVTLLHHSEEIFNFLAGSETAFKKTIEGLRRLEKSNLEVTIKLVPQKPSYLSLKETYVFCRKNFPRAKIMITGLQFFGETLNHLQHIAVRYSEVAESISEVYDYASRYGDRAPLLYRFPLCTIDPKYWEYAVRTASRELLICPDYNNTNEAVAHGTAVGAARQLKCDHCAIGCNWYAPKYIELYGEDELIAIAPKYG